MICCQTAGLHVGKREGSEAGPSHAGGPPPPPSGPYPNHVPAKAQPASCGELAGSSLCQCSLLDQSSPSEWSVFVVQHRHVRLVASVFSPICIQTSQEHMSKPSVMLFLTGNCLQATWTSMSQLSRCHSSHLTKSSLSKSHMAEAQQGPLHHPHHTLPP